MTIYKSQGGTFDHIVYEYDRSHSRELVYVALSRVTSIGGLFLVTKENTKESWEFWHDRAGARLDASKEAKNQERSKTHLENLPMELERLQQNTLQTITKTFIDFISKKNGLSIFTF